VPEFKPDAAQTLAFAAVVLFAGLWLKKKIGVIDRLNIPAPVVGGLVAAVLVLVARQSSVAAVEFDNTVRPILEIAFFTTIGMSASLALLRKGGIQVVIYLAMAAFLCLAQNFVGLGIAIAFGVHPLVGVMAGSVTLVGGPATGGAFAKEFAARGVIGADSLAIAAATFGIVCGGLLGGPMGTWLIERKVGRKAGRKAAHGVTPDPAEQDSGGITLETDREDTPLLRNIMVLALAMGIGVVVSAYIAQPGNLTARGITLPGYIGAMFIAGILRNLDDWKGWFRISPAMMDMLGNITLLLYLAITLLRLRLWELAYLAVPLIVILLAQVVFMGLFAWLVSFPVMGRDYDSAVMATGLIGFALGTVANALTNMRSLVERYGPAPRAFLIVPLVGAYFIDFINAAIITAFLQFYPVALPAP
jgi:ESS family glutamate:Na+ symporter